VAERSPVESELQALAEKIERLLQNNSQLHAENRNLRAANAEVVHERESLLAKNEQARSRVEAMIVRLKALEQAG